MKYVLKSIQGGLLAMAVGAMISTAAFAQGNSQGKGKGNPGGGKPAAISTTAAQGKAEIKGAAAQGNQEIKAVGGQGKPEKGGKGSDHGKPDAHGQGAQGSKAVGAAQGSDGSAGGKGSKAKEGSGHGVANGHSKGKEVEGAATPVKGDGSGSAGADGSHGNKENTANDFGQARAEAARAKTKTVVATAETHLSTEEQHVVTAKDQIKAAQAQVETMKNDPKADKAVIASKEELIRQVELKAKQLDEQIQAGKAAILKAKTAIETPVKAN